MGQEVIVTETRVQSLVEAPSFASCGCFARQAMLGRTRDAANRDGQRPCHHLTCPVGDTIESTVRSPRSGG
jgi:hypothetical protein